MLREKTQRRLFRALFALGCVVPTLAIGGLAAARMSPIYRSVVLACVGDAAGVSLTAARLETPRPGVHVLEEVRVADASGADTIALCDRLRLRRAEDGWSAEAGTLRLTAGRDFSGDFAATGDPCAVAANVELLVVQSPDGEELGRWPNVVVRFDPRGERGYQLEAQSAELAGGAEARVSVVRDGANQPIRVRFDTGGAEVGCRVLPEGAAPAFLRQAAFVGSGDFAIDGDAHGGGLTGELRFPETDTAALHGFGSWRSATARIESARWWGPIVTRLHAEVEVHDGVLHRDLVCGACERLGCNHTQQLRTLYYAADADAVPFERLACRTELDFRGLRVASLTPDGAVLTSDAGPLLMAPPEQPIPLARLVQALWPFATPELPATAEAREVASRLPLRSASAEPSTARR